MEKIKKVAAQRLTVSKRGPSFDEPVARAFGTVVRQARISRSIAQDELALLANVDRSYYGKLERGERQPSLGILFRLANALEVPASELVRAVELALTT